jgi:monoamine oxidase
VWTSVREALAAPVGRLHWAGTEASARWPGFIEGAPQAGADAAAAVGAALDAEG